MTKHVSDGITHAQPTIYKCKLCGTKLTQEQYDNTECEDFKDEE